MAPTCCALRTWIAEHSLLVVICYGLLLTSVHKLIIRHPQVRHWRCRGVTWCCCLWHSTSPAQHDSATSIAIWLCNFERNPQKCFVNMLYAFIVWACIGIPKHCILGYSWKCLTRILVKNSSTILVLWHIISSILPYAAFIYIRIQAIAGTLEQKSINRRENCTLS